ncbi:RidA family protein [bacterium]|nr:RidA family protein [bacterium]
MRRDVISTDKAPKAIGPYSQAIVVKGIVYTSGQIPIVPETGEYLNDDIKVATRQVLKNLEAVLVAAGSSHAQVIKVTVFLADMDNFAAMNEVYAEFFADAPPARSAVQAARLPKDAIVEMEAIAQFI